MKRAVVFVIIASLQLAGASVTFLQPAAAAGLSAAQLRLMRSFTSGTAAIDAATVSAACAPNAQIVDEFAPYRWSGAGSAARYVASLRSWASANKLAAVRVQSADPRYFDVSASAAWVSMPSTYSFVMNGKPAVERGVWVFVLVKSAVTWRIASAAWATTSLTQP